MGNESVGRIDIFEFFNHFCEFVPYLESDTKELKEKGKGERK